MVQNFLTRITLRDHLTYKAYMGNLLSYLDLLLVNCAMPFFLSFSFSFFFFFQENH